MPRAEPLLDSGVNPQTGVSYRTLGMIVAFGCIAAAGYFNLNISTLFDNTHTFFWTVISLCAPRLPSHGLFI